MLKILGVLSISVAGFRYNVVRIFITCRSRTQRHSVCLSLIEHSIDPITAHSYINRFIHYNYDQNVVDVLLISVAGVRYSTVRIFDACRSQFLRQTHRA